MRTTILTAVMAGLFAGSPADLGRSPPAPPAMGAHGAAANADIANRAVNPMLPIAHSAVAAMPDRGSLLDYSSQAPIHRGAAIWHPVQVSESHALAAIAAGGMVVNAPDGAPIRLRYVRHVEHADGNWTWIGRQEGTGAGQDAVLTFGPRAVFGSIPLDNGQSLDITTSAGRTWIVETDQRVVADQRYASAAAIASDALQVPKSPSMHASAAPATSASVAQATGTQSLTASSSNTVVDLVIGYTSTFAARLGGTSQAVTRLNFMVDVTNQAYANSRVSGRVRLVHTVQVDYPDATLNRDALFDLSGLNCTIVSNGQLHLPGADANCTAGSVPAALKPLVSARSQYGADLVSLVRIYQVPENQSCGVSWLIGGGQTTIDASDAPFALSVVSDTSGSQFPEDGSTCRNETLAHELGHNMGLAHDRAAASRGDGVLDANEYGRYPYSFGYSTDSANGNFYTIMSIPVAGQTSFRLFSNPRITDCGGRACGVAGESDNAKALSLTMPIVASFQAPKVQATGIGLSGDFNGDGKADILWRDTTNGNNAIWLSGNSASSQAVHPLVDLNWVVAGIGDFNADHRSDILWRNAASGRNVIWFSANSSTTLTIGTMSDMDWDVAGIGDFNGDGKSDILWRNSNTGANVIWRSASNQSTQAVTAIADNNVVAAGVGDFNGDHKADILWRNTIDGGNVIWRSGNSATRQSVTRVADTNWVVAGVADVNGDGRADIAWRKSTSGSNAIWLSASSSTPRPMTAVANLSWGMATFGDFNRDGQADVVFRNYSTGANVIWRSANSSSKQAMVSVATKWVIED